MTMTLNEHLALLVAERNDADKMRLPKLQRRYCHLVLGRDDSTRADAFELLEVMRELKIDPSDMAADIQALQRAAELETKLAQLQPRIDAATAEVNEARKLAESARTQSPYRADQQRHRAALERLAAAQDRLVPLALESERLTKQSRQLQNEHHRVFSWGK